MARTKPKDINGYISDFPEDVQKMLEQIRNTIKNTVPDAEGAISYGIPAFNLKKRYLIYFAAFKKHIGIYPAPVGQKEFAEDFSPYKTRKGTVQFPLDQPLPLKLIEKIVKFRVKENLAKTKK